MKKIILLSVIGILFLSEYGVYAVAKNESMTYSMLNHIDDYDMVIIAPSDFSQPLQPLIEHKITYGVTTFLKTTEEIYAMYAGRDPSEQIKYYLEDAQKTHEKARQ